MEKERKIHNVAIKLLQNSREEQKFKMEQLSYESKTNKVKSQRFNNQGSWEQKSLKKETILGSKTPLYQVIQVSEK
jgi:hypothetical protein